MVSDEKHMHDFTVVVLHIATTMKIVLASS